MIGGMWRLVVVLACVAMLAQRVALCDSSLTAALCSCPYNALRRLFPRKARPLQGNIRAAGNVNCANTPNEIAPTRRTVDVVGGEMI